jgi:hypothetical protein
MLVAGTLGLGLLVCAAQAATAGGAVIETSAPLLERSDDGVRAAVVTAIEKAVRGAAAMGFAWVELRGAEISGGREVVVQIVATDEEPDEVTDRAPDARSPGSDGDLAGERGLGHTSPDGGHI